MKEEQDKFDDEELISKSQLKRDAHELTQLGKDLVALQAVNLEKIPMESDLRDAINEARNISSHGALKRQHQYIGKLLRNRDTSEIYSALDKITQHSSSTNAVFKQSEKWRERLLAENTTALQEFIDQWPDVDRQKLRQLIRSSNKEKILGKPPKSSRLLFRYIRELLEG